ncbi:unnamed protein product [Miscanthus lutarioriparius]|uniref:Uncharacterized protein n=1 Tax=Miscanthus lutarioriparius TaxID=422564 RepID=A0A811P8H1_9POAL|nr:unnamed protein product [Miscanthus lutarioriparius]
MKHVRWGGILQRIALAYLVVAVLEIVTKDAKIQDQSSSGFSIFRMYFSQWIVACCILVIYLSLVYGIYVPDWEFRVRNVDSPNNGKVLTVTCGTRGILDPPCNAVGYIDRKILGINYMYQKPAWRRHRACTDDSPHEGPFRNDAPAWCVAPFEPEGILRLTVLLLSIPQLTFCGVEYDHRCSLWACACPYEGDIMVSCQKAEVATRLMTYEAAVTSASPPAAPGPSVSRFCV